MIKDKKISADGKVIRAEALEAGINKPHCFGMYLPSEIECAKCYFGGKGPGFECPKATKAKEVAQKAERETLQKQRNINILRNALQLIDKMYEGLELGVIHKRKSDGAVLESPKDIIKTLLQEGEIECIEPGSSQEGGEDARIAENPEAT